MPRKAEAEPEASSIQLQRQCSDPWPHPGEDGLEMCHPGKTTRQRSWSVGSGAPMPTSSITAEILLPGREEVPSTFQDSFHGSLCQECPCKFSHALKILPVLQAPAQIIQSLTKCFLGPHLYPEDGSLLPHEGAVSIYTHQALLGQGSTNSFCKRPNSTDLGFARHMVSVPTIQLFPCSVKAARDNM